MPGEPITRHTIFRNPLVRHIALFLAVKAALIALGLWWFVAPLLE